MNIYIQRRPQIYWAVKVDMKYIFVSARAIFQAIESVSSSLPHIKFAVKYNCRGFIYKINAINHWALLAYCPPTHCRRILQRVALVKRSRQDYIYIYTYNSGVLSSTYWKISSYKYLFYLAENNLDYISKTFCWNYGSFYNGLKIIFYVTKSKQYNSY